MKQKEEEKKKEKKKKKDVEVWKKKRWRNEPKAHLAMIDVGDDRHVTDVGLHIHHLTKLINGEVDHFLNLSFS